MPTPLNRVFEIAGCRTQTELAEFLGISQSAIADAKKRGRIPSDWLLTLWRRKGANPDWILTGQGSKGLQPTDASGIVKAPAIYITEIRPPEECSIEELVTEIIHRVAKRAWPINN